jgi:hypothetical protein
MEEIFFRDNASAFDSRVYYPGACAHDPVPDIAAHLDVWRAQLGGILGNVYRALPVNCATVKKLERVRDLFNQRWGPLVPPQAS